MSELERQAIDHAWKLVRSANRKTDAAIGDYVGAREDMDEAIRWLSALLSKEA